MTEYFNWQYYVNKYKELEKANINTKEKAYAHWIKYGLKQNRICNIIFEDVNLNDYIKNNRLKIVNKEHLYIHYYKNNKNKYINNYEPVNQEQVVLEPVNQEPVVLEPVNQEPVVLEPVNQEPVVLEPINKEPVVLEPVVLEPVNQEPVNQEPINQEPINQEPVNQEPIILEPVNQETDEPQKISKRQQKKNKKLEVIE